MSRPMRLVVCHPGADWSTADVFSGLVYGLRHHGVEVVPYSLNTRIEIAHKFVHVMWRKKNKDRKAQGLEPYDKPTKADVIYQASLGALEIALRERRQRGLDAVLIVSGMFMHPDAIHLLKEAGLRVVVLFTESPYDIEHELKIAAMVDGCWTNERSNVGAFKAANPNSGYLPHGWHPRHHVTASDAEAAITHDVVFVGSGFPERIEWFNAIDWTGIDLGLYGTWTGLGLKSSLRPCVKATQVENAFAASLYRRAKIGLNLYRNRSSRGIAVTGDSLSPRAYELAACGAFHLSDYRPEVAEVFGDLVPTFTTPQEAEALIRKWLADDAGRADVSAKLPACVAEASWLERASRVIGDLQSLMQMSAAA